MNYLNLFGAQKPLQNIIWGSSVQRAAFTLALIIPLTLLSACSDDKEKEPETELNTYTVPSSNSRMPSGGTLESQYDDSPVGYGLAQIVDGNNNSKFITYHSNFYILWTAYESVAVNYYSITSADDAPENDPKTWTLSGSNDNSEWTLLDSRTDITFTDRKQKQGFEFNNTRGYKYIRLDIKANNGGTATQIAEYSLQLYKLDISDLMQYASGHSHSEITPMGNHYANKHVTTEADRQWLADASNEPPVPEEQRAKYGYKWEPFRVHLYPTSGNPSPADCNQHGIGDCSAIAVFGSFAYIYPDFVKAIIKDNNDGSFTVAMFDPQGKPVDVTVSSVFVADAGGTIQSCTGKNNVACWSTVLEKAVIKWNAIYNVNPDINGIGTEHVVPLFTGNGDSFAFDRGGVLTNDQLKRAVEVSLKQGKIVVGGFNPEPPIGTTKGASAHAYTLMHSSVTSALFSMRNPWGGNPDGEGWVDDTVDGVLNIPNNTVVPPTIDLRIVEPGIAANFGSGAYQPYYPPAFAANNRGMRVSEELLRR